MKTYLSGMLIVLSLITGCGNKKQNDRDRFFLRGNVALSEREYDDAIKFYSESIKIDPEYAIAYNNRGIANYEDDDLVAAISDYSKAIIIDNNFTDAYFNRANSLIELGRYDEAVDDLLMVMETYPDSSYVHFALGLSYDGKEDYEEALRAFDKSLSLDKENAETYLNLAVVYYHRKEYDKANEYLAQAFARDNNNSNYYNIKALILMEQQNLTESIDVFNDGLYHHPEDAFLLNNRGYAYIMMDSIELADKDIDDSILKNPDNLWAYRNKGIIAYKKGDYNKAERLMKRAMNNRKYVDDLYSYLGLTYLKQNKTEEACRYFEQAIEKGEKLVADEYLENCQ
ncbi:MAG: tetratricopeptide repeat protein [Cyclobacteriaceae bacterium]